MKRAQRRLSVYVPFEEREVGIKILFRVLRSLERKKRYKERDELLTTIADEMVAFMQIEKSRALEIAEKYAVVRFKEFQPRKSYAQMRKNVIDATQEIIKEYG